MKVSRQTRIMSVVKAMFLGTMSGKFYIQCVFVTPYVQDWLDYSRQCNSPDDLLKWLYIYNDDKVRQGYYLKEFNLSLTQFEDITTRLSRANRATEGDVMISASDFKAIDKSLAFNPDIIAFTNDLVMPPDLKVKIIPNTNE